MSATQPPSDQGLQSVRSRLADLQQQFDEACRDWRELVEQLRDERVRDRDQLFDDVFDSFLSQSREILADPVETAPSPKAEQIEVAANVGEATSPPPQPAAPEEAEEETVTVTDAPREGVTNQKRAKLEKKLDRLIQLITTHVEDQRSDEGGKIDAAATQRIAKEVVQRLKHHLPTSASTPPAEAPVKTADASSSEGDTGPTGTEGPTKQIAFDDIASMLDQLSGGNV